MAVEALYALQNGFLGFERAGLFYGDRSPERVAIPVTCYLVRTGDATILFDTGIAPRALPGLVRQDPLCRFSDEDLLVHRLDSIGLEPKDVDLVVLSHLHFDHAGGAAIFDTSELVVQKDEYAYAQYPAAFFASYYYRKNFDLPGYRWRLLDGDTELVPGVTALRSDGDPGRRLLLLAALDRRGDPARRRVGPDPGHAQHQAAQDARPAHRRTHLPEPRPRVLGQGRQGARRVQVNHPSPCPLP